MTARPIVSRLLRVDRLPAGGQSVDVEATPAERDALARAWSLPGIARLAAHLTATPGRNGTVTVAGQVDALLTQICVVTLDPFESEVTAPVEIAFAPAERAAELKAVSDRDPLADDPPDAIENGAIDLGAVAVEFLALSLDPHPRKPGAAFTFETEEDAPLSPFASLARLRPEGRG